MKQRYPKQLLVDLRYSEVEICDKYFWFDYSLWKLSKLYRTTERIIYEILIKYLGKNNYPANDLLLVTKFNNLKIKRKKMLTVQKIVKEPKMLVYEHIEYGGTIHVEFQTFKIKANYINEKFAQKMFPVGSVITRYSLNIYFEKLKLKTDKN